MSNRIIGLDLGTKTLGIAITDDLNILASGLENFTFNEFGYRTAINHTIEILNQYGVKEIALGYPLNMNGSISDMCKVVNKFKEELLKIDSNLKITLIDERLTTSMSTKFLLNSDLSRNKRKKVIDKQSARLILDTYLTKKKNNTL